MYAVIRTGGKQYTVKPGDLIKVNTLPKNQGEEFELDEVLFISGKETHLGEPTLKNAKVTVVVTKQGKEKKIIVFKKRRRQGYRKMQGHRQEFTELFVKSITSPDGESLSAELRKAEKREKAPAAEPKKTAAKKKTSAAKKVTTKKATKKKASTKKTAKKKTSKKKA